MRGEARPRAGDVVAKTGAELLHWFSLVPSLSAVIGGGGGARHPFRRRFHVLPIRLAERLVSLDRRPWQWRRRFVGLSYKKRTTSKIVLAVFSKSKLLLKEKAIDAIFSVESCENDNASKCK